MLKRRTVSVLRGWKEMQEVKLYWEEEKCPGGEDKPFFQDSK